MIKDATFTSVWDGDFVITTPCKVNMETKEVFDIHVSEGTEELVNNLDEEFVTIDGVEYEVSSDPEYTEFWYD